MTPLVEIPPVGFRHSERVADNKLAQIVKDIRANWGTTPLCVDLGLLPPSVQAWALKALGEKARYQMSLLQDCKLSLVPVTGLNRNPAYQAAVASMVATHRGGACIRLRCTDIQSLTFRSDLNQLLSVLKLQPTETDLLVDYRVIDESCPSFASICESIPDLLEWRSFTISSGAFTKDLRDFEKNCQHQFSRLDWQTWCREVTEGPSLPRMPTYGDYTVQHAIYYDPPERAHFSASIRYTADEYWVIMRGESVFSDNGSGYEQWPANAYMLCQRDEFCGADFSAGDAYFMRMGSQLENGGIKESGGAETWIRAGINHHLTFVVRQIASLFDPSTVVAR